MTLWPVHLKYANLLSNQFSFPLKPLPQWVMQEILWPCLLSLGTVLGRVRENFLLNLWSLPIGAVIRAVGELPAQGWKNEVIL